MARGDKDARAYLIDEFNKYGIGDALAKDIWKMLQGGMSAERISIEVQETPTWKQRFKANEARRKKGLPVLQPAEYLALERSYRQVMEQAGLPKGFYDSQNDFDQWIGNDVSPTEIQGRVTAAQQLVESADGGWRNQFERLYGKGNLVAYALDRKRTVQQLEKQLAASRVADVGADAGFQTTKWQSERLAELGVDEAAARGGFAQARERADAFGRLSGLDGGDRYSEYDAVQDVFFQDEEQSERRRGLASQERARFSGSGGLSDSSLASGDARGF